MRQRRKERIDASEHKFRKGKEKYATLNNQYKFPNPNAEEIFRVKKEIREKLRKERRINYIKWTLIMILILIVLYIAFSLFYVRTVKNLG
ncbi:hypothetical protein EAX61_15920 [Dokdonia sinensis]|uniref:Uncharacterized protein n=2 Tax=Dokdonia sinensis TaxID=2479847 RepID=A0A3M0FTY2_9FLAO|nr:hypothetical protein EAX61_15920 [Dokdonia sinensis]